MNATNEDIQIYGKLVNISTEGVVADASQIWSMVMQCVEKATLEKVMEKSQFNQSKAAEMLGITRNTLRKKLISYQIIN